MILGSPARLLAREIHRIEAFPQTTFDDGDVDYVYYVANDQHIYQYALNRFSPGEICAPDCSGSNTKLAVPAVGSGSTLAVVIDSALFIGNQLHFADAMGHVNEINLTTPSTCVTGGPCNILDLTSRTAALTTTTSCGQSSLAGFINQNGEHVYWNDFNGQVHQFYGPTEKSGDGVPIAVLTWYDQNLTQAGGGVSVLANQPCPAAVTILWIFLACLCT